MYLDALIPVFQVSLPRGYNPGKHLALGRALAPLRDKVMLIVGSSLSYHNMHAIFATRDLRVPSKAFNAWLGKVMARPMACRTADLLN
jgi:aromatic ring-opening dioxygenase catalytic subunit (LigB family)